jgi:ABC-type multidrug transport system fused ATPase/permease subunit
MTSVERVLEYTNLETEKETTSTKVEENRESELDKEWPTRGDIEFENVSFSYDKLCDPVLKNVCFRIKPGEKIGIMGRTGAGKSSVIQAIFRMAEQSSGRILIDNINIADVELSFLRNQLSIIPVWIQKLKYINL